MAAGSAGGALAGGLDRHPVGAMRAYEFDAKYLGDWAIHCHKSHHTMNAMGHDVPTFIGVDKSKVAKKIRKLQPDYMPMGNRAWPIWARWKWKCRRTRCR
jgi:hypothetical protein